MISDMAQKLRELVKKAATWPQEAQDELVQVAEEIEHELGTGAYRATPDELKGTSKNNATDVKLDRLCGSRGS